MKTLDLFYEEDSESVKLAKVAEAPLKLRLISEEPEERARRRILALMRDGLVLCLAYSSGKDSTCLASLVLLCAVELAKQGGRVPPILIIHSSTGIENPIVSKLAISELKKMVDFGHRNGIDVRTLVGEPDLNSTWQCRVLGGRALPAYPNTRADCSIDLKTSPNRRLINRVLKMSKDFDGWKATCLLTGVRRGESTARDQRIAHRRESAEGTWVNDSGDLRASPILDFTESDVWEHIGLCAAGVFESFSNFEGVMDFYRSMGNSSCVVVADMKMKGSNAPCGARSGCWACTRVGRDRSVENMIESDEKRYSFLRPLNRLRNYLANSQYNWSLRQYVGRTINDGYIEIAADTFSPATLKKLLVYTLTAERLSGVKIISPEQLIAIDLRWSLYGLWPPFSALKTYFELIDGGHWEEAPVVAAYPPSEVPRIGRIFVGAGWYEVTGMNTVSGMRDLGAEIFHESCGFELKTLKNGALVADYEEGERFEVDPESAADFITFLAEDYIRDYCHDDYPDWTEGVRTYLRLGMVHIGAGQSRTTDEIMRRTQWRQEHNLHGQRSPQELEARCDVLFQQQQSLI
ncbi:phosphoadenosine phosphosulfate reductase family protein [Acidovorax sp. sic0104]|uniref:phosphoadenosine phosphosulfate reductase domain-containing protein n=1 Tax=Acidovorax sp. sic0104 TaxID=2854784 RepID=UPI001C490B55|nr:phosphoadenosine phosphosulfate reductase family protein [Acidovorax sp. sic0104]MBV7542161.1 phosphoadenosine phosphosulfate reductase family protein [Acidovorax sp. sic0104]